MIIININVVYADQVVVQDDPDQEVRVRVVNRLGYGQSMKLRCQSNLDDLGSVVVKNGREMEWLISSRQSVLGMPLIRCDIKTSDSSPWYTFEAYDPQRDFSRCQSECRWMIPNGGALYGYDQRYSRWVWFPYTLA